MVPLPGHFPGHTGVVLRDDGHHLFFSGDATYSQEDLLAGRTDGVTMEPAVSAKTLADIRAFAKDEPTVLLPAHDPDAPRRLAARETLPRA